MPGLDTGLLLRVKRLAHQTADQHRHLSALRREIEAALGRGALSDACTASKRFEVALKAHFDLEQGFFFPALHGLSPSRSSELEALEQEHMGLLAELRGLAGRVEQVSADASLASLARWQATLSEHEKREEILVAAISEARDGL